MRDPIFKKPEELGKKMTKYFLSITRIEERKEFVFDGKDEEGKDTFESVAVLNQLGEPILDTVFLKKPSITAMAHYCGITRETLCQYQKKEGFSDTIKKHKEIIETYLEGKLEEKNVTGIIFNLKNNYGWVDKQDLEHSGEIKMPEIVLKKSKD